MPRPNHALSKHCLCVCAPPNVQQIMQAVDGHLVAFRGCVQSIGTQFDDEHNRSELKRIRGVLKDMITNAESELKVQRKAILAGAGKIALDRQARQLEQNVKVFQDLLEKERTSTKQNPLGSPTTATFGMCDV